MRKHIVVDENLFKDFLKTSNGTHNDILYKLVYANKNKTTEEPNVSKYTQDEILKELGLELEEIKNKLDRVIEGLNKSGANI